MRQTLEVLQHGGNKLLPPRVFRSMRGSKKIEEITRLLGSFLPVLSGCCQKMRFQFIPVKAQRSFIGLHLPPQATKVGCFLSRHPAMVIQIDALIGHGYAFRCSLNS